MVGAVAVTEESPSSSTPSTWAATATTTTVITTNAITETSFATSSRVRPNGAHQQVAQRPLLGLAGHRVARGDRHGDRQEQRQHDAERREREERAVGGEDGGQERRAGNRWLGRGR